eukprot:m.90743 g.90743  ORF g.90743 m.90743 type:complete len:135 (+) comp12313_c0_seq1:1971-2375(+)
MDQGRKVWAPSVSEGFVLGEICDFGTDALSVQPLDGGKIIEAPYDAVYPAEDEDAKDQDDNCALMYLNEGTLLNNLRRRFMKDKIYTYTANILLALNPTPWTFTPKTTLTSIKECLLVFSHHTSMPLLTRRTVT